MDALVVTADSPQEDEFALLSLGVPSLYAAFLVPSGLAALEPLFAPAYWSEVPWFDTWRAFVDLACPPAAVPMPVLLKSPNHTWRWPAISVAEPASRAVWMARDPAEVLASNRRLWREMCARYAVTPGPTPDALDRFLAVALWTAADVLDWAVATLPASRFAVVGNAALRAQPARTVAAVVDWLSRPGSAAAAATPPLAPGPLVPNVSDALEHLREAQFRAIAARSIGPSADPAIG
jgi:hypothetical protein